MDALILAAGEGRRLRPLTDRLPKALVEVGGVPLVERVARRLVEAGADRLIINAHHRAHDLERFVADRAGFGVECVVLREDRISDRPLDTGGAVLHARDLLLGDAPFWIHNADIVSDVDLKAVYETHRAAEALDRRLATLVVSGRPTSRPLLVDEEGMCGRANRAEGWEVVARHPRGTVREVGFAGIHVVSPRLLGALTEHGAFSIVDAYVRLIGRGATVGIYDASGGVWHDVGTPERLEQARAAVRAAGA